MQMTSVARGLINYRRNGRRLVEFVLVQVLPCEIVVLGDVAPPVERVDDHEGDREQHAGDGVDLAHRVHNAALGESLLFALLTVRVVRHDAVEHLFQARVLAKVPTIRPGNHFRRYVIFVVNVKVDVELHFFSHFIDNLEISAVL